jgi:hypothetical protein
MEGLFLFMAFSRVRKQDLKCISRMQCGASLHQHHCVIPQRWLPMQMCQSAETLLGIGPSPPLTMETGQGQAVGVC